MFDEARSPDEELKSRADEICRLIQDTDYPAIDITIQINELREWCRDFFPDRMPLFEMIYANRFRRLWEQFRSDEEPLDL